MICNMLAISDELFAELVEKAQWIAHDIEMRWAALGIDVEKDSYYMRLCDLFRRFDEGERSPDLFVELLEGVLDYVSD